MAIRPLKTAEEKSSSSVVELSTESLFLTDHTNAKKQLFNPFKFIVRWKMSYISVKCDSNERFLIQQCTFHSYRVLL